MFIIGRCADNILTSKLAFHSPGWHGKKRNPQPGTEETKIGNSQR